MRGFIADTSDAFEAGVFDDPDGKLCWIPLVLDEAGAGALSELVAEFVDGVLALLGSATGRQVADGDDASASRTATVFLASFPSTRDRREGVRASAAKLR